MAYEYRTDGEPDLGDLVIVLLASTRSGLRHRLESDGFPNPAQCVAETVVITDHYLEWKGSHG
jgi:hypothetical protein